MTQFTNTSTAFSNETDLPVAPAGGVIEQPPLDSIEDQVAHFREHGYLLLPGTLSDADLAELDAELNRIADNYQDLPAVREGFSLEPKQDPNAKRPIFRKVGGISDHSDAFKRLLHHERILSVLHRLVPEDIHLHRDVVMMKPAKVGREKPWHQDSSYWPYQPMDLISAMTALDDATPDNGCLQVIPGTHKKEVKHYGKELRIDLTPEQQAQTRYVPLRRGDTLLFHSLLLHASEPNHSEHPRRVCIFSYLPSQLTYIRDNEPPKPIVISRKADWKA